MTTVRTLLREAPANLPHLDRELLLGHVLGQSRTWLFAHPEATVAESAHCVYSQLLARRSAGEPLALITGEREFWSLPLRVTSATLVPRPATELLVETALARLGQQAIDVVDLGTGSGAIAAAIASERPAWRVVATDRSEAALGVARKNLGQHAALVCADWCESLRSATFDLALCNPPYIAPADKHLAALGHEPRSALVSADAGLRDLSRVVASCPRILRARGWLIVEHGYDQAPAVRVFFRDAGFHQIDTLNDLEGHPRATLGQQP